MTKYDDDYRLIRQAQDLDAVTRPDRRAIHFSLEKLNGSWRTQISGKVKTWVLKSFGLKLMQRFFPTFKVGGIVFVTRYDDVVAVLKDHTSFNVPFGPEMQEMAGGTVFALGDDGEVHSDQSEFMHEAMKAVDIDGGIRPCVRRVTQALLADAGGEIDVARDVFRRITSEACLEAMGIETDSALDFADYSAACSALIFGDPNGTPWMREQAMIGAKRKREVLDMNIRAYTALSPKARNAVKPKRVLHHLVDLVEAKTGKPLDEDGHALVRTMLFGIITGFVPTAALGAGKLMVFLRKNP